MTKEKKPGDELFRLPYMMTDKFFIHLFILCFGLGLSFLWLVLK